MTPSRNGSDPKAALERLRQRLPSLRAKDKVDALLDHPNARAVVRALAAEELYQVISEVGLADATELVQLASPRQFQSFVDLSSWEKDRLDVHKVMMWLRAARGDDTDEFLKKVHGLDFEILELALRKLVTVHDLEETPDVNPANVTMESPEGRYLLEFHAEGAELAALRALLRDLYSEGPLETARMLEAIRWELPTELEETAYQFSRARLEDMGFPPSDEAAALFSFVEPEKLQKAASAAPGSSERLAPASATSDYVAAALEGFSEAERAKLEAELRYLMNSALVVEGASPGDPNALREMTQLTRDTLNLGLEYLTAGNPAQSAHLVDTFPLKKIFQVGFSLTLKLKHHADRLAREPGVREGATLLFLPDEERLVAALRRKRPRRPVKVEGADPVPFRSRRELQEATAGLARAALQVVVFRTLLGTTRDAVQAALAPFGGDLASVGTQRLFAGLVAHGTLDGAARLAPVPESRLVELCERLFEGDVTHPRVRASAIERASSTVAAKMPEHAKDEARRMVTRTLERLREEFAAPFFRDGRVDAVMAGLHLPLQSGGSPTP